MLSTKKRCSSGTADQSRDNHPTVPESAAMYPGLPRWQGYQVLLSDPLRGERINADARQVGLTRNRAGHCGQRRLHDTPVPAAGFGPALFVPSGAAATRQREMTSHLNTGPHGWRGQVWHSTRR
jgi:hypothetical protein